MSDALQDVEGVPVSELTKAAEGELLPRNKRLDQPRCYSLKTLTGLRREMARQYKRMRDGEIESSHGSRLVFALGQIGKLVEIIEIEKRLDELERLANARLR